jgi:hypothetical protein
MQYDRVSRLSGRAVRNTVGPREATLHIYLVLARRHRWEVRDIADHLYGTFDRQEDALRCGEEKAIESVPAALQVHNANDRLDYGITFRKMHGVVVRRKTLYAPTIRSSGSVPITEPLARQHQKRH